MSSEQHNIDTEQPLPVGLTEFHTWADRIISLAGNYADNDSMKWALASMIMHAPPDKSSFSDRYFLDRLRKSAANQIAAQVFQDIKLKQEEQAKKAAEATASTEVVANEEESKNY